MLHGDKAVIDCMLTNEATKSLYFAWDVVQAMACNDAAREYLQRLSTWALNLTLPTVVVESFKGPMWGTFDIPGFVTTFVGYVADGYEYTMSEKKKEGLRKALRARLTLLFEGVPRNKKAMLAMYPELVPVKKRRKKK